jgi:hypothetical protein
VKASMSVWNLARQDPRCRIRVAKLPVSGLENLTANYRIEDLFDDSRTD